MVQSYRNMCSSDDKPVNNFHFLGSTWMLEILFCLLAGDFETADSTPLYQRTYFLDNTRIPGHNRKAVIDVVQDVSPPRIMKTHLPASFFSRQLVEDRPKTVILLRNPKDALVSYYHYYRMSESFGLFPGSWNDFFRTGEGKEAHVWRLF